MTDFKLPVPESFEDKERSRRRQERISNGISRVVDGLFGWTMRWRPFAQVVYIARDLLMGIGAALRRDRLSFLVGATLVSTAVVWFSEYLKGTADTIYGCLVGSSNCASFSWWQVPLALVALLAFAAAIFVAAEMAARILSSSATRIAGDNKCRVLVMGLSNIQENRISAATKVTSDFTSRLDDFGVPTKQFEEAIARMVEDGRIVLPEDTGKSREKLIGEAANTYEIPWQQNFRAIRHHRGRLKTVLVLPSQKSLAQWDGYFAPMAEALMPGARVGRTDKPADLHGVATAEQPFADLVIDLVRSSKSTEPFRVDGGSERDYEDYDYVLSGFTRAIETATNFFHPRGSDDALEDRDICVDITAGTKPVSVAGAVVTLNRDLRMGYVSPRESGSEVVLYDAQIRFADRNG